MFNNYLKNVIQINGNNYLIYMKLVIEQGIRNHAKQICKNLLDDIFKFSKSDNSIKYFRKDLVSTTIWLYIMNSYYSKNIINIEDIAREIAPASRISKPSLRLILENAKIKGFIKFTHNSKDHRSWIIEPEEITINEFNEWSKVFI